MESLLYIVLSVVGLFVVMNLIMRLSAVLKRGKKIEGVKGALGKSIASGARNLVYFYSQSCSACKPMTPVIDKLKNEYTNIHKIDIARDMETARIFGIMGTPALVRVDQQKISSYQLGARTESAIRKLMQ